MDLARSLDVDSEGDEDQVKEYRKFISRTVLSRETAIQHEAPRLEGGFSQRLALKAQAKANGLVLTNAPKVSVWIA